MITRLFCTLVLLWAFSASAQRYTRTFATVADMVLANPNDVSTNAVVLGRVTPGDGGGGNFWYDKASSTTTNLGTIFTPSSGTGRWKRVIVNDTVSPQMFGAVPDGTTDNTAAMQAAADTILYGTIQLTGTNVIGPVVFKKGVKIIGQNPYNTCLKAKSGATGWLLSFDDTASGAQLDTEGNQVPSVLEGFSMDGTARGSDIGAIYLNHCDYFVFRNLIIWRFQRSGMFFNSSVRESLADNVKIRFCGKGDATNNNGGGWPALSVVDWEPSAASTEDKHNGIHFGNCQVVYSIGDGVAVDTKQTSNGGRRVSNISFSDCWFHGWSVLFWTGEFANTLTNSATLRQYNLFKVGAAYDVRMINNRFSYAGQGKPSVLLSTSALGGTPISGVSSAPENVQVVHNFFNGSYSSPTAAGEVAIKADAGSGVIADNIVESLIGNFDLATGWKTTQPRAPTDRGLSFDGTISSTYAGGTMGNLGTSPFTIHARVRLPDTVPASAAGIFSLGTVLGGQSTPGVYLYQSSNGNLYFYLFSSTGSDSRTANIPYSRVQQYMGQPVDLTYVRSGTNLTVYLNGGQVMYDETTAGTAPTWATSVPSDKWSLGVANSGTLWTSGIHEFRVANRAMTAAEVMSMTTRGTKPLDQWGTMTSQASGLLTVGAKYRITQRFLADFTTVGSANNTIGTEFTATGTGAGLLGGADTVIRLGWVVDPDLDGNSGTAVYDRTSNGSNGALVGAGVRWARPLGAAAASGASSAPIDQPDRGYSWDGVNTSSYLNGSSQQLGTDAFTIHARVRWPKTAPASAAGIYTLTTASGSIAVLGAGLVVQSSGDLQFLIYGATVSDFRIAAVPAASMTQYAGVPVDIVVTRSGATLAIYVNGVSMSYSEATGGSSPAWSSSLTTDKWNVGVFTSSQPWVSSIGVFRVANRALTAAEVAKLTGGVQTMDTWGSTTTLNSGTLTVGKRYVIVARVASDFTTVGSANNTPGTEFVATGTGSGLLDASNTVRRLGWFLDVDLTQGLPTKVSDRSSNGLHGTVTGSGVIPVPGNATSTLELYGTTSGKVTLTTAAAAGTPTFKLPTADGTTGQFLKTDGAGQLSFATISGGGDALVANPLSQFAATTSAQLAGVISDETGSGKVVLDTNPTLSAGVTVGTAGGTTGNINLKGTTSGTVTLTTAAAAGTHTIKLPTADGTANQLLKTDGAGQWGWVTGGGGGDALVGNPLSQFASTTSAQLAGVISDETGSGALVFAGSPTFTGTVSASAETLTGQLIDSLNGAANAPPVNVTGSWFSGGTSTTTKPQLLVEPTGTTSTGWSASGTGVGINGPSGFAGNLIDAQVAGVSKFAVASDGAVTIGGDAKVLRDAANTLAMRNGSATAQRVKIYNTYTAGTADEWFDIDWITSANKVRIGSNKNGSGVARIVEFIQGGTAFEQIDSSGNFYPVTGNGPTIGISGQRFASGWFQTKVVLGASGADVNLGGESTGVLQIGLDAGAPVTQAIKAFDGSGTSIAGSDLQVEGGQGTGTAAGGSVVIRTAPAGGVSNGTLNGYSTVATFTPTGDVQFNKTVTAGGTTGAQTINKTMGRVNFAAAATTLVVTDSLVTANSIIICTVATNDTTMKSVAAVAGSGSFTIYANSAPTAETAVNFVVFN